MTDAKKSTTLQPLLDKIVEWGNQNRHPEIGQKIQGITQVSFSSLELYAGIGGILKNVKLSRLLPNDLAPILDEAIQMCADVNQNNPSKK